MFKRLSLKEIRNNYNKQFHNNEGKIDIKDLLVYFVIPWMIAIFLGLYRTFDNDLKSLLGTIFSILIGMYLTLVVLLISNIIIDKKEISIVQQRTRLNILEETIYVILYAVSRSIYTIIILLLYGFVNIKKVEVSLCCCIITEEGVNFIIKAAMRVFLYLNACKAILSFFLIIRNLISLFSSDLLIERTKLHKLESEEDNKN